MCALGDEAGGSLDILQTDVGAGSDVDDDAVCAGRAEMDSTP